MNNNYISTASIYDFGEHLEHRFHKYYKKEQTASGNWIYYYDRPSSNQKKSSEINKKRDAASSKFNQTSEYLKKAKEYENTNVKNASPNYMRNKAATMQEADRIKNENRVESTGRNMMALKQESDRKRKEYLTNTPLGKIENLPNEMRASIEKGKIFLKNLFK